jgi:hypothetical protein
MLLDTQHRTIDTYNVRNTILVITRYVVFLHLAHITANQFENVYVVGIQHSDSGL